MRRFILTACAAALLAAPAQSQYGPGPGPGGYDAPEQMVEQWYRQFLGRRADPQSSVWVEQLRSGQPPEGVLAQILGSTEYYNRAGGSPDRFVAQLHRDLTGRPIAQREIAFWVNQLYRMDRNDLAYQMTMRYPQ